MADQEKSSESSENDIYPDWDELHSTKFMNEKNGLIPIKNKTLARVYGLAVITFGISIILPTPQEIVYPSADNIFDALGTLAILYSVPDLLTGKHHFLIGSLSLYLDKHKNKTK